jgi:hypothetical protein
MNENLAHIDFYPQLAPDECLSGSLVRYHMLSGNIYLSITLKYMIGSNLQGLLSIIPKGIDRFSDITYPYISMEVDQLLEQHTVFPFVRTFFSQERVNKILYNKNYNGLDDNAIAHNVWLGIRSKCPLKYCLQCIIDDLNTSEYAYWKRCHQLLGVSTCHVHGSLLKNIDKVMDWGDIVDHVLKNTCKNDTSATKNKGQLPPTYIHDMAYAKLANDLLISSHRAYGPEIIYRAFRVALFDNGYMYRYCDVNFPKLRDSIISFYSNEYLSNFDAVIVNSIEDKDWLQRLLDKNICVKDIRHSLLLILFLFGSANAFLQVCEEVS